MTDKSTASLPYSIDSLFKKMKVFSYFHILAIALIVLMSSCKSGKIMTNTTDPKDKSDRMTQLDEIPNSQLLITYKIAKPTLRDSFQQVLDSIFETGINIPEQNISVSLRRTDDTSLDIKDRQVLAEIPLLINISKRSFLGNLFATGQITLHLISDINITPQWEFQTATRLEYHEWIEKPKIGVGAVSLPGKWLMDEVVKRIKERTTTEIDRSIAENFDLRQHIAPIAETLLSPYQIDSTAGPWLYMQTDSIYLSPIMDGEKYSMGQLSATLQTSAHSAAPPHTEPDSIPAFGWRDIVEDRTILRLWTEVQYEYLGKIAQAQFVGKTFSSGKREITINDLSISGNDGRLVVKAEVEGSFDGTIVLVGRPVYEDHILTAEDVEWDLQTKNVLHQAASWLGKGYIIKQLDQMLTFDMNEYIEKAQEDISAKLQELKSNQSVDVQIDWGKIDLEHFHTHGEHLEAMLSADMQLHIIIDDLRRLNPKI